VSITDRLRTLLAGRLATDKRDGLVVAVEAPGVAVVRYSGADRALMGQQRIQECTGMVRRDGFRVESLGFARWTSARPPVDGARQPAQARRIPPDDPRLRVTEGE
jgi:hypothetical protein